MLRGSQNVTIWPAVVNFPSLEPKTRLDLFCSPGKSTAYIYTRKSGNAKTVSGVCPDRCLRVCPDRSKSSWGCLNQNKAELRRFPADWNGSEPGPRVLSQWRSWNLWNCWRYKPSVRNLNKLNQHKAKQEQIKSGSMQKERKTIKRKFSRTVHEIGNLSCGHASPPPGRNNK